MSVKGGRSLERYAKEVAEALGRRGEVTRRPRLESTRTETIAEGLFGLRFRSVTHHDDGGSPRFWIVGMLRADGRQALYHPHPGRVRGYSWMAGNATIMLENGNLRYASWREDPIGSYWIFSDVRGMDVSGMTMLDYADEGKWRKVSPKGNEQYCEKFDRHNGPRFPASVGLRASLERLFDGTGIRIDGIATGMASRPHGPEWLLN